MITRAFTTRKRLFPTRYRPGRLSLSSLATRDDSHQRGYGKIVATSSGTSKISTHLTELSHSSPMRLVPSRRSHPTHHKDGTKYEAAVVHLSSYGGGFVPGDVIDLDIDVRGNGAIVYVLTQGGTRIYRPGDQFRQYGNYNHQIKGKLEKRPENESMAKLCQSTITCTVEPGATLLFLPDPTVPYLETSFEENRIFTCQYTQDVNHQAKQSMGSIISVDWYGSGRRHSTGMEGERWAFDYLSTRTELHVVDHQAHFLQSPHGVISNNPILIEAMTLDNTLFAGKHTAAAISMGKNHDSYATLLLHGPNSLQVAKRAKEIARYLASLKTRVRELDFDLAFDDCASENESDILQLSAALGGNVLMSVSPIENEAPSDASETQTHVARILAESNEDIYRILHFCLKPCSQFLGGLEPYKDRIYSSGTVRSRPTNDSVVSHQVLVAEDRPAFQRRIPDEELRTITNNFVFGRKERNDMNQVNSNDAWFYTCLFSDSALPVGSFAHSLGTEAASQIDLFSRQDEQNSTPDDPSCSEEDLADYIYAVSRSNARFSTPIILGAYSLASSQLSVEQAHKSWLEIDNHLDKLLKSNGPGRRASMDQGLGFLRIAPSLLQISKNNDTSKLWKGIRSSVQSPDSSLNGSIPLQSAKGHAAPMYGMLAGSLEISPLDACRVFAFGAARDSVSAAVRLNLLGPVAGLSLLNDVGRNAVEEGLEESLLSLSSCTSSVVPTSDRFRYWLHSASTCAPILDVVQPCHDLLSVRLFRT